ncbi:hypothetical protein J3Q64DRAFT_1696075 [Phycomyces blakesleeanus]|uniref:Uncharacterized protein n=2 Tax=Phycomyces blakesleeanus TaxID=4837 RepID=A0A162Q847_PHYB8|nr:hypothetical protein PHYBLDRAFT_61940 [Phycomyces blakesleeanus NRRL 1555(-)]OAD80896.1 hypothetical protein PHYBLDRAFT_61940 [Phycomyces blakesleeanus NRRL 1555(-)]|eukprot:XP_018298936.1 hypothetical protein PHYBLDRAFT_61940 [Phycomyces blakesleeanus NRRL 1555(-)]
MINSVVLGSFYGSRLESEKLPAPDLESNSNIVAVLKSILVTISAGAKEASAARTGRSQINSNAIPSVRIAPMDLLSDDAFIPRPFIERKPLRPHAKEVPT